MKKKLEALLINTKRKRLFLLLILLFIVGVPILLLSQSFISSSEIKQGNSIFRVNEGGPEEDLHPLAIESLREREYAGSNIVIEQELISGSNYNRYIASYKSEGLKIFGLLTIPSSETPEDGWPAIIFNHGFISPDQYVTTQRYEDYVDGFARNGYVVFKPDYRGHGNSEGTADGNYYSPGYVVDVLNATSSVKNLDEVNPGKIGMWGHSMGGNITMKNLVISNDIKVAVIWAGVVGSYEDVLNNWSRARQWRSISPDNRHQGNTRQSLLDEFGTPEENPDFWNSIDPYSFLDDINSPIQLHHGTGDTHVPISFSENFKDALEQVGKSVELYTYEGADQNLSGGTFNLAMQRSVEFFDRYLK